MEAYEVLGVPKDASEERIRSAYKALVRCNLSLSCLRANALLSTLGYEMAPRSSAKQPGGSNHEIR